MVLNSESFKSSDLMYLEYADRIVKSLDQDDNWDVWFEFYFGDTYDVVINLQEKMISFVNSYFQEAYMHPEKHFENPGIIYKGLYLKSFEFPNTVEDDHKNYLILLNFDEISSIEKIHKETTRFAFEFMKYISNRITEDEFFNEVVKLSIQKYK